MNVIQLPTESAKPSSLILLMIDLQMEYIAEGRAFELPNISPYLENCRKLLNHAREKRFPIIHFRRLTNGAFFNRETQFSRWIEAFRPKPGELYFEHEKPSCFSDETFDKYLLSQRKPTLVVAGFTAEFSCIATVIDAYQKDLNVLFVKDASPSGPIGELDPCESHATICEIMSIYCDVISTDAAIGRLSALDPVKMQMRL